MNHRLLAGLLLLGTLQSCGMFESREARTQKLVDDELQGIDFNDVDQFPLFDQCDETAGKAEQRACFEETLRYHLAMKLQDFDIQSETTIRDTLYIDFRIDNQGILAIQSVEERPGLSAQNPEFRRMVTASLQGLPRLQPALKRGIPVATRFRLPLVLKTDD